MTIYISQGRYTSAAIRGMTAKPEDRSEAVAELFAAAGGRLIGWYLTFGHYDWLIIAGGAGRADDDCSGACGLCRWQPHRHHHHRGAQRRGHHEGVSACGRPDTEVQVSRTC